ncbi:MAG: HDOD domain-containing protein [Terriglobia bacterium]
MVTNARNQQKPWALIDLPPFPAVAMRVLSLLARQDVGMKELTREIQSDPALALQILTLANSVLFGFRTEIKNVLQATALLGAERVKAIALTIAMKTYLMESFQIPALLACWRHSLACALIAEDLAMASMIEKDVAYVAGLLHDIGRLALGMIKPIEYANMLASAREKPFDILEREREMFGMNHCEAGRWLTDAWKLPKIFGQVAALHHHPPSAKFDVVRVASAACLMADALGFEAVRPLRPRPFQEILQSLPAREQVRFHPDPEQLAMTVAMKINSLE